jgi:hypothetical protein
MLVEPRHLRERRLRPQAGCEIQRPEFTAEPPTKRFCRGTQHGVVANCSGASPSGTLSLSGSLRNGLLISHSPFTSADRPSIERWLTSPQVAHGGMWIYIDPSTAYRDTRTGEQLDGIIHPRYHTHPPDRERPNNQARVGGF